MVTTARRQTELLHESETSAVICTCSYSWFDFSCLFLEYHSACRPHCSPLTTHHIHHSASPLCWWVVSETLHENKSPLTQSLATKADCLFVFHAASVRSPPHTVVQTSTDCKHSHHGVWFMILCSHHSRDLADHSPGPLQAPAWTSCLTSKLDCRADSCPLRPAL